jgi:hypothetical protein
MEVEPTDEREQHITDHHPDLLPTHRALIDDVLSNPEQVRRSPRMASARMFSRWYDNLRSGKHVVVVVAGDSGVRRHWIVTAYIARNLAGGTVEWARS